MITKEKFKAFIQIRDLGVINMNDYKNGAKLANISEDDYCEIIVNFKKYNKQFVLLSSRRFFYFRIYENEIQMFLAYVKNRI